MPEALTMPLPLAGLSIVLLITAVLWVRLPIALILAGLGILGAALLDGPTSARTLLGNEIWGTLSSYSMTVIPLFIFMGQVCFHSGLNQRLYRALNTLVGHIPGGLAVATLLACGGFSAICGSNTATAATMAGVAMPEMQRYGYRSEFAAGTVAVGATLGAVIPPSVVLIVIGLQTGLSISTLFLASVFPGILLMVGFALCAVIAARLHPDWARRQAKASCRERLAALPRLLEVLVLWSGVLGGMGAGLVTPTEAGGLGALIALLMGVLSGNLGMRGIIRAGSDTLRLTAMILLLLAGAMIFGKFMTLTRLPFELSALVTRLDIVPAVAITAVMVLYFLGGMIIDALALLLITVPIFFPMMEGLGLDMIWFSMMVTVVTTIGAVTPPVGVCAYVVAATVPGTSLPGTFRGIMYFMPAYVALLVIMALVPQLTTILPTIAGQP